MKKSLKIHHILMYLGAIPFIYASIAYAVGKPVIRLPVSTDLFLSSYTLAIGSFMAGTYWWQSLGQFPNRSLSQSPGRITYRPGQVILASNIITLGFWGAFIFFQLEIFFLFSAALFCGLLSLDFILKSHGLLEQKYFYPRVFVTLIVAGNLIISSRLC